MDKNCARYTTHPPHWLAGGEDEESPESKAFSATAKDICYGVSLGVGIHENDDPDAVFEGSTDECCDPRCTTDVKNDL